MNRILNWLSAALLVAGGFGNATQAQPAGPGNGGGNGAGSSGGGSVALADSLARVEAKLDELLATEASASVNATLCFDFNLAMGGGVNAVPAEVGARWDIIALGAAALEMEMGAAATVAYVTDVCVDVPLLTLDITAIGPNTSFPVAYERADGSIYQLGEERIAVVRRALEQAISTLSVATFESADSIGDIVDDLNIEALLTAEGPLIDVESAAMDIFDILGGGTLAGSPLAGLPILSDVEAVLSGAIQDFDPCELVHSNALLAANPEIVDLICAQQDVGTLPEFVDLLTSTILALGSPETHPLAGVVQQSADTLASSVQSTVQTSVQEGTREVVTQLTTLSVDLADDLGGVQADVIGYVETRTAELEGDIAQVIGDVGGRIDRFDADLDSTVSDLGTRVTTGLGGLEDSFAALGSEVNGAVAGVAGELQALGGDVLGRFDGIENSVATLGGEVTGAVGDFGESIDQFGGELAGAVGNLQAAAGSIASISGDVGRIGTGVDQLGASVGNAISRIDGVGASVASVRTAVSNVDGSVNSLRGLIDTANSRLSTTVTEIAELKAWVDTANSRLATILDPAGPLKPLTSKLNAVSTTLGSYSSLLNTAKSGVCILTVNAAPGC